MAINIDNFKTFCNKQTFVPYYARSASTSHFPTSSSQLVLRRIHWRMTLGSKPGSPVVSFENCPNCFHQSFGPLIDFAGRRVSHLLDSIASPQHNHSTPSSVVYLEVAFHPAYPRGCLSVAYRLGSMQLPEALLRLCLLFRPMIPPTLLLGSRNRVHEHPPHLLKELRSPTVARLPAWANWPPSPGRRAGLLIGRS